MVINFLHHFLSIFIESAPWLLFGYFIAGLIKAFVPTDFLHRHLGNNSLTSVVKGAILGAPLPLCSCGVIPAALGIRRAGASKAATTSFLIATPETGVDSVSVTYALLGPFMAIIRPLAAVITAISAGLAVLWLGRQSDNTGGVTRQTESISSCCSRKKKPEPTTSCCSSKIEAQSKTSCCETKTEKTESNYCNSKKETAATSDTSSCCSNPSTQSAKTQNAFLQKVRSGLSFTFIDLIKDTVMWLLMGLVLAALIMTIVPPEFLEKWGASPYAYVMMAVIGVPMYICAVASTPIAAGLLFAGVSPGAVLVFLLVGPATNIATLAIVRNELGTRVLGIYLSVIVLLSFLFGYLTDVLSLYVNVGMDSHIHHHEHTSIVAVLSAVILAGVLINGVRLKYQR